MRAGSSNELEADGERGGNRNGECRVLADRGWALIMRCITLASQRPSSQGTDSTQTQMPQFKIIGGFFSQPVAIPSSLQSASSTKAIPAEGSLVSHPLPTSVEQVPPRFGLLDESPDRWAKFRSKLAELNQASGSQNKPYKLLLLVRHGEGYHNVAEAKYGTQAWDDYWSKLEGDGVLTWGPDPLLTSTGIAQAQYAHSVWEEELGYGLIPPAKIYCSPFSRALKTCEIVFEGYEDTVLVIENAREENGVHTCDKRRTQSYISSNFPAFAIEPSLTEEDLLWNADVRETKEEVATRAGGVLERVWQERSDDDFVAITAHSGFINGVLLALGSKPFALQTGGVLPLVLSQEAA